MRKMATVAAAALLEDINIAPLPELGQALWSWPPCARCLAWQACLSDTCPCRHGSRLQRYLQFYKAVVSDYVDGLRKSSRALKTHGDLFRAISILRSHPDMTRSEFCRVGFPQKDGNPPFEAADLRKATALVVKVLMMVECSAPHQSSDRLEKGSFRVQWKDDIAFSKYIQDLFPVENHHILSYGDSDLLLDMKSELRAVKLKKHLGISFRATHDVRSHLYFDRQAKVLEIFHHTAFLKEQLRATKGSGDFSNPSTSIRVGALPRQLVLEVLDSIQGVLFPLSNPRSKRLLQSLVQTCSLDPDVTKFEFNSIRNPGEENVSYVFLADRLSDLYNEVRNPRPSGWLERRMERKSGARYMMMATLIGVVFAVLLGMASLAVSSYQTWIAYQAWQHPIAPAS
ncbi:hypothetical protein DL766_000467 [Monosporascus sp. MC13-8B]|uniref:Uncharacterized protein n=1 Tax=Monosporascus cannonballus TaxID=155416 RepID=A0ABY0HDH3_9PEZI|nr:hypothetical protein DL762_002430 [Monosporascus cannonballus]RYP00187.1 hypothetical protein DL763_000956 [Monosporascus cannonballus]RYP39315.1 hypothetical protein DL766_000467 [Monosporascus sp. MC13-8B]